MATKQTVAWQIAVNTQVLVNGEFVDVKRVDMVGDNVILTFADDSTSEPIDHRQTVEQPASEPETAIYPMW